MKINNASIQNYKSFEKSGWIPLRQINVLVGKNNAGKSAFIRAINLMQTNAEMTVSDIRLGNTECVVTLQLTDVDSRHFQFDTPNLLEKGTLTIRYGNVQNGSLSTTSPSLSFGGGEINAGFIPAQEPDNFIYTYLSKRKVRAFDQAVDRMRTLGVEKDLRFLVSKVARLANSSHERSAEYDRLCQKILGFRVSTHASPEGMQAGIPVGRFDYIPIESMGEGVSSLLGLITDLCIAENNLFLIEELENDIHPEGLKTILEAIIDKSQTNQFIISTHSNIVTKYLGAAQDSTVLSVESTYIPHAVPTSNISPIEATREARMSILRQLGYELYDFDLWEGWLILEESSAEVIIKDFLIPWFTPKLSRIRTIAAGGTSKVEATFEDFRRLFLFTHLETQYRGRAWVVVDGDESGKSIITKLQKKYGNAWPTDHFRAFSEADFERYYPERFASKIDEALAKSHNDKPAAKKSLLEEVKRWCDEDPAAKTAFEKSAHEVVELLKSIEFALFGKSKHAQSNPGELSSTDIPV
ncbi:hypothetical protein GCM10023194_46290 [Planotetraspora phitsanulokensis]|uniref:ATPase AAA-type core domain-containing protein n=1 Tax=Planotetraspora phitsanulokensis TaxID=575192 RepID=A0A8J3XLU5_9ACTN|nr:AAA family ATPase [Planotetraspora phitsanulokensis]GII41073.1 hypothetical protein Pph01_60760 [Planotetraspora phitsanulokensis]